MSRYTYLFIVIYFSSCIESKTDNDSIEIRLDDHRETKKVFYQGGGLKNKFQVNLLGQRDGISYEYYENEKIKSISYYKNGLLDSTQQWFYPSGIKQAEIFRLHGQKFGSQKMYDSLGNIEAIYFVTPKCDSCISSIIYFDQYGSVKEKDGHMVYCVYEKQEIHVGDTAKVIFYVIEPDFLRASCTIIEQQKGSTENRKVVALDFFNNNKGYLFFKKFDYPGDYKIGLSVDFLNTTKGESFKDSIFMSLKVIRP
ncbi:MAG: hypothetical protein E6Q58_02225 [Niabella sp.]|nr:MAG: hypothetical protein E6Q58_02225 [Niabella sp.]